MRLCLSLFLLLWSVHPLLASAAEKHPITPEDIATLDHVDTPRIAPDGQTVVYTLRRPVAGSAKPGPARLWQTVTGPNPQPRPLAHSRDGDNNPRWSPGSDRLAFLRAGSRSDDDKTSAKSGDQQIWIAAPLSAPPQRLTALAGSVTDFRWSPDGNRIAAIVHLAADNPDATDKPAPADAPDGHDVLYMVDAHDGKAHRVAGDDGRFVFDVAWGPEGKRLLVRYADTNTPQAYWYTSHVAVLALDSGPWTPLPHHATAVHPSFSPDGRQVVYGYFQADGITAVVAVHDLDKNNNTVLGANWPGNLRSVRWNQDGQTLTALAFSNMTPQFAQVDASTGRVREGLAFKGDPFDFSRTDNGGLAYVASTRVEPAQVWFKPREDSPHRLTHVNSEVANWRTANVRRVHWQSRDGQYTIHGMLVTPADGTSGPYKTLVEIHGGPYESWYDGWQGSWVNWGQVLASHGYAVLLPNPRGSAGRSPAFALANRHDWGGADFQDILTGVHALAERGVIDIDRVAIGGWSYGGFMSAWAATQDDPFKAAIVGAGISDLQSMALSSDVGLSFMGPYFGDPSRHHAEYAARSPINFVNDVHMPVLILHGEADTRVPFFQGRMLHRALAHDTDQPSALIGYPKAPHWFGHSVGASYRADIQQRVLDWLNRYLDDDDATGH
ncbi:S9 family peptidase [Salinisphaera sp. Q1T1-3]|uniref:S9 family peptidase n=1 Tax=Salinisphaera sp. Q1T1-3 TaxID=2321229 RepID=UPI0013143290|nr:S9 family peptidase [Salinisphaera sp. Q1T1-3]